MKSGELRVTLVGCTPSGPPNGGARGEWSIDYASDGFSDWNAVDDGYGGISAVPVPTDHEGDSKTDFSVRDGSGT